MSEHPPAADISPKQVEEQGHEEEENERVEPVEEHDDVEDAGGDDNEDDDDYEEEDEGDVSFDSCSLYMCVLKTFTRTGRCCCLG